MRLRFNTILLIIPAGAFLELAARGLFVGLGAKTGVNPGVSFGLLSELPSLALGLSAAAFALVLGGAFLSRGAVRSGLSLTAAGAAVNLLERLSCGGVIDWIPLPFSEFVMTGGLRFNLADVEIVLGALIAAWGLTRR